MNVRRTLVLLLLCFVSLAHVAQAASPNVVISQVSGGGGNSGAQYKSDFIELFNRGTAPVSLSGWSVQYASASGTTWAVTPLSGTLAPGQYYLVQEAAGAGSQPALPTADASGSIAMSATAGKVALVSSTAALTGSCPTANVVDFVGFGGANCSEGAPTATLSNSTAARRAANGCTDTDQNNADFTIGAPTPRNTANTVPSCGGGNDNAAPTIHAFANPVATVAQDAAAFAVGFSGLDDNNLFNWSAVAGAGVASVAVSAGQGTANVTYTVTLQAGFSGTASFTAQLSDNVNPQVTSTASISVNPAAPPPLDHVVISQIYGGGGNSGATYRNDYVELYNASTTPFDLGGWTVQYASATGTAWQIQPLGGIMQPGEYYLVQLASGGAVGALLPAANVNGSINISGTTGKVALVMGGDPLDGCPTGDPLLVDLVGYGTTANCREGLTNAPAPSNTTAAYRKNGGLTDTNVNGADFVIAAPNPRRTTPIVEIGPYVLTVDPRKNVITAPRDASINVTFTEPVTVDSGWFTINCVTTGNHDSATVASAGSTWIITPNVNFLATEQCTVTIFKDAIHDVDFDDSDPNTDTLTANYSWTFTVATGTAPVYTPDVHTTFGNPSDAVVDELQPNNYLMEKPEFALSYNRDKGTPNWVSWHLDTTWVGSLVRVDTFRPDPAVLPDWYRVLHTDYQSSGFDRGHMVPNADRDKETSMPINQATFLMTNMIPQTPDNNQGPWADMENDLRALIPANEMYIVAGPAGIGGTGSAGFMTTLAGGKITVPSTTWKCALVLASAGGDDLSRVTGATRTICVIMPNIQGIRNNDWQTYLTSVDAVEQLSGYDLFSNLPNAVENAVESGVNGANKPGVADSSVTTDEDVAAGITLDVAAANNNPLTYTILTGPANGVLSGSGANRTYTPAPDFNGNDSFTFQVSDGANQSNIGTVSITVSSVNDAPVATITVPPTTLEGSSVTASVSVTDVDHSSFTYSWTVTKDASPYATGTSSTINFTPDDNGSYGVSVTATDASGGYGSDSGVVTASNVAPSVLTVTGPTAPVQAGTAATITVTYSDPGSDDTHSASVTWDDSTSSTVACAAGVCSASHTYAAAGIYGVTLVVSDDDGGTAATSFNYIVVTDAANSKFVTGGGWVSTTSGKASLNVNAKYLPNGTLSGNTHFKVSGFELASTSYDWLVVSGANAQYQGTATVNGSGAYGFLVTVTDGSPDKFRIRVWDKTTLATIFDNATGAPDDIDAANPQAIGGGNITIH
jgi:DNA/RNA endonuclease G (NUC1)